MSRKLKFEKKIIKSSLSHIVLLKNNFMFHNVLLFIHLKNVQDWLYVEHYLLQQTMRSMLFCVKQNNSLLGNTHVDHIL